MTRLILTSDVDACETHGTSSTQLLVNIDNKASNCSWLLFFFFFFFFNSLLNISWYTIQNCQLVGSLGTHPSYFVDVSKSVFKIIVRFFITTKIDQNKALCLPYTILWHDICHFFLLSIFVYKIYLKYHLGTCLAFQMSVLERLRLYEPKWIAKL